MVGQGGRKSVYALKVRQWLPAWNEILWNPDENRSEPPHWFYQFSMPASCLRQLSGVYARTTDRKTSAEDYGIQRQHNEERSKEIGKFVEFGYPWSDLSEAKRRESDFNDLRQPGWLPTAVVVNILVSGDERVGKQPVDSDLITVEDSDDSSAKLLLPQGFEEGNWIPSELAPIEIIDGQHRLWAFDATEVGLLGDYELPVVAFVGLDLSWQAYLFYTINIKPKKINASLAFDLYPLLRTERWLEKFEGHSVYRETRSQELVDKLWSYHESPWHHRINMLGETGHRGVMVTQAAWVRSLMVSFVKNWEGPKVQIGGIFGAKVGHHKTVLLWNLPEQAAFLIFMGMRLQNAVEGVQDEWAQSLREQGSTDGRDLAFFGPNNLLNQDQGIRTLMQVVNDLFFVNVDKLRLYDWGGEDGGDDGDRGDSQILDALLSLNDNNEISNFMNILTSILATYDWRAASCPDLTGEQRILKASFRGSGGYRELRRHVLQHVGKGDSHVAQSARDVMNQLGYSE